MEGAKDNLPDPSSLEAAKEIANLVSSLIEHDLLFVLVTKLLTATSFKVFVCSVLNLFYFKSSILDSFLTMFLFSYKTLKSHMFRCPGFR
jgi:hypothetical protein